MVQPLEGSRPEESLRVAVCQLPAELEAASDAWQSLCEATSRLAPDLLLLGEMPFGPWVSAVPTFDSALWRRTLDCHDAGLARLDDLGATAVAGTRPREAAGRRLNEAFVWSRAGGIEAVHAKRYFPDEPGYYEARWFDRGTGGFASVRTAGLDAGFLICTELMFNEHARAYGRAGASCLLVPRAVGPTSLARWLVAAKMASIVSGAWLLSSNRVGCDSRGQEFGGAGWVVDPFGTLVASTSAEAPVVAVRIQTATARSAQREYPCYVEE